MSVYMIVEVEVKDKDTYGQYIDKVRPIVEKYSGRYLTRGGRVIPIFGNWDPERIIVIEFPSFKEIKSWLNSEEYKEVMHLREKSTATRAILVEGNCEK